MKRNNRPRIIRVNDNNYCYRVTQIDPQNVMLKIWSLCCGSKTNYIQIKLRFDDPWLNYGEIITAPPETVETYFQLEPVTPKKVRQIVTAAINNDWNPNLPKASLIFEWQNDSLIRIDR